MGSDSASSHVTSDAWISSMEIREEGERDDVDVTPIQDTQAAISDAGDLAMNILLAHLPPLSKYSGNSETETFEEWHEQFQLVATVCKWDNRLKLANLATRLQGQAYSFYRTSSQQQRTSYESLMSAISQRFRPVRIQAVQSGQFHSHNQRPSERVDDYAQDLSRLYQRAYPQTNQGSKEAEEMGQKVLVYQFVSGLLPELKVKVAGAEGTFDQLWIRARFEEAKLKDFDPTISSCEHWWRECQQCWIRKFSSQ